MPPEGVVDVSMVRQGRLIPEAERGDPRYRMSTDLMGRQGRDEPYTPRDIVPFRPDDPKGTVLADPTQLRGKEALFSAIATDPQLQSLVGSDIDQITQMMVADLMQGQPRILTEQELTDYKYAPGTVVQELPGGGHNVIQQPVKPTETFHQMSSEQLYKTFPGNFSAEFVEENAGKMWNYSDKNKKITALGGAGQTINVGGDKNPFFIKFEGAVAVDAGEAYEKARVIGGGAQVLDTMLAFFDDPDFGTGKMESALLPLRQWGRSLGLDIDENDVATAEVFNAKAQQLVLGQVEFMKGALSNKELDFLEAQVAGLEKTRNGNKLILWLGKSTAAKASAFARYMRNWRDPKTKEPFQKVGSTGWFNMLDDWEKSDTYTMTPKEYIMELAETDEELWKSEKVPEDEIANRLENRYSLSLIGRVFKDY